MCRHLVQRGIYYVSVSKLTNTSITGIGTFQMADLLDITALHCQQSTNDHHHIIILAQLREYVFDTFQYLEWAYLCEDHLENIGTSPFC